MNPEQVRRPSFSLVEMVIVVVIIGTIAAIAVPRLSRGAAGAGESSGRANLAVLRTAIDVYAAEHDSNWPGADGSESTLIDQLTKSTDAAGSVGNTVGVHIYGPYLHCIRPITVGPNTGVSGVILDDVSPIPVVESNDTDGWCYNFLTGEIIANTDDLDSDGVAYNTY